MTAIARSPGPAPGCPSSATPSSCGPARLHVMIERWGRRYGPAFRFTIGPRRWSRSPSRTRSTRSCASARDGYRRWRELESVADELGLERPVHVRGRRLAPPAPARGHRAQLEPPAALLRRHPHRHRAPARRGSTRTGRRSRSSTTSWPTASTSPRRWPSGTTSTRSSTATASCSCTSRSVFELLARRILSPFPYWHVRQAAGRPRRRALARGHPRRDRRVHRRRRASACRSARNSTSARELPREHARRCPSYSDQDVFGNVFTMLLAGEDTTANTLSWAMSLLARDPAARSASRPRPTPCWATHRMPRDAEDVDRMLFAEAVFREAARLKSTAPLLFFEPLADTTAAGVELPAGHAHRLPHAPDRPPAAAASASTPTAGSPTAATRRPSCPSAPARASARAATSPSWRARRRWRCSPATSTWELAGPAPRERFGFTMRPHGPARDAARPQ